MDAEHGHDGCRVGYMKGGRTRERIATDEPYIIPGPGSTPAAGGGAFHLPTRLLHRNAIQSRSIKLSAFIEFILPGIPIRSTRTLLLRVAHGGLDDPGRVVVEYGDAVVLAYDFVYDQQHAYLVYYIFHV